jgi:hypothetical protein
VDSTGTHQTTVDDDYGAGNAALSFILPHVGRLAGFQQLRDKYAGPQKHSVEKGGLLDTSKYDAARGAQLQNVDAMAERAAGRGPSVAPQMMQNTTDSNIEAALQAQASGKSGPDLVGATTAAQQNAAGQAAGVVASEVSAGQAGMAQALADQQQRDLAFSRAQQQAAWQQTMTNVGLGLQQQALIDNILTGAGQGLQGLSDVKFGGGKKNDPYEGFGETEDPYSFDPTSDTGSMGDYPEVDTSTDISGDSDTQYAAHGGRIKRKDAEAFARAYGGRC